MNNRQSEQPSENPFSKRVLFITPQPFMADRGSPLRVLATLRALSSLGYKVDVLAFPFGEPVNLPGVTIYRSPRVPGIRNMPVGPSRLKILMDSLQAAYALWLTRKAKYDVIHGVEEAAFAAAVLGKLLRIPYIVDMHSFMVDQLRDLGFFRSKTVLRVFSRFECWSISRASSIMTVSEELSRRAREIAEDMHVVTARDLPLESINDTCPEKIGQLRKELRLTDGPTVLYAGNLHYYQGVEILLRGFALSLKTNPRAQLLIVGGEAGLDPERERYITLAHNLDIQESVRFVQPRPAAEMGNFFALADILASPRLTGCNTPLKIYSYLASGRSVLATRIQSHTQVLDDSVAYLCEPVGESIAETLTALYDSSDHAKVLREEKIKQARHLIDTKYSPESFQRAIASVYSDVAVRWPFQNDGDLIKRKVSGWLFLNELIGDDFFGSELFAMDLAQQGQVCIFGVGICLAITAAAFGLPFLKFMTSSSS